MYHFIVSSKDSKDRRETIEKQFQEFNLGNAHFFDAIMGNRLSQEELSTLVIPNSALTPGEIGCALSHLSIYKTFLESTEPVVVIFEDDAIFDKELFTKEILNKAISFVENQTRPTTLLLRTARFKQNAVAMLSSNISIHKVNEISETHAYIINRQAAENILKLQSPLKFVIDCWRYYSLLNLTTVYCLNVGLVKQSDDLPSIIMAMKKSAPKQTIGQQRAIFKKYVSSLPLSEQKRIKRERLYRTLLRLKAILKNPFYK